MKKITIAALSIFVFAAVGATAQVAAIEAGDISVKAPKTDDVAAVTEESPWASGGVAGTTVSQTALSNWSAGGDGSVAFDLMLNYGLNYKNGKHLWQNRLELAYGMNVSDSKGAQKTNDKIYFASMYGYSLSKTWYLAALLNFNTQFANGYDYKTEKPTYRSRFMAPGYLSTGIGFTWHPKKWFTATLSPATWRGTFVLDDDLFFDKNGDPISAYGVEHGKHMLNEIGANFRFEVNYDIWQNVNLYTRLDLYSNYLKDPQNVDVKWDIMLTAKINKWLSANLSINMIYDDDVKFAREDGTMGGSKLQVKEVLGIGLQASF